MKIKVIIDKKGSEIYSIPPDATLGTMAEEMNQRRIGSLLVLDDDQNMLGIVTERDFLRNVTRLHDKWEDVLVSDVMTSKLITTTMDETLDQVMEKMSNNHIRHIPVLTDDGKVAGLLSVVDIIRALHEETAYQNSLLKRYIQDWPEKNEG